MSRIRWGRVIIAALLSELGVIAVLMAITGVYILVAHKSTMADIEQFGERAGYYVAPLISGLATFLGAQWATRKLAANFVLNGTLVGIVAVVLTAGMLAGAKPEDRLMYVVSFILRIAGGYLGGLASQTRSAAGQAGERA